MERNAKVLIVDDSIMLRQMMGTMVSLFYPDVEIIEARNGLEGLTTALSADPDVIILDFNMPIMNGYEMAMALRQDATIKQIPLILHSSESDCLPELTELCDAIWRKPSPISEIQSTLQQYLLPN